MAETEEVLARLNELNKKHIFIMNNGKAEILNIRENGKGTTEYSFSSKNDFELFYSCEEVVFKGKQEQLGKAWIKWSGKNIKYGIGFNPNGTDHDIFNLWHGFNVKPKPGNCNKFLDHIYNIIASGNEEIGDFILDLMADAVQNPGKKPGVALVMRGEQGTGKSLCVNYFAKIFEPYVAHVTNGDQIFGRFNSILSNKLIVFLDEGLWSGDKQKGGNLKALVTESTIVIEQKGRDPVNQPNFVRLFVATNSDWTWPAEATERRACVIDVSSEKRGDHAYFDDIVHEMENGGPQALLDLLIKRNISGINLRDYPKTSALDDQKEFAFSPLDSWWKDCLIRGNFGSEEFDGYACGDDWTTPVTIGRLYALFTKHSQSRSLKHHLSEGQFGKQLKKLVPNLQKPKLTIKGNRVNCYVFPDLEECRSHFNKIKEANFDWE